MQTFIDDVITQLGVSEATARSATGGALVLLSKHIDPADFEELLGKLPGSRELLADAPSSGGGLGGLLGKAAGAIGGDAASARLEAMSMLSKTGLDLQTARPFFSRLLDHIKLEAGDSLVTRIAGQLGHLTSMVS